MSNNYGLETSCVYAWTRLKWPIHTELKICRYMQLYNNFVYMYSHVYKLVIWQDGKYCLKGLKLWPKSSADCKFLSTMHTDYAYMYMYMYVTFFVVFWVSVHGRLSIYMHVHVHVSSNFSSHGRLHEPGM